MSNVLDNDVDILEMVDAISLDDVEMDNDIREWLQQTQLAQIQDYGFSEVDREEEYSAILNEISHDYLMER
ncbi:hypothetical protein [Bacillus massilinigeriensis]|uniref:hypothetical protein n=1 Tax=Bacillus massilionigeriensis TaxID=1805475 RepID=UPI00096B3434|nr:hypothetical protein [Bacillus massilionigeriensis]